METRYSKPYRFGDLLAREYARYTPCDYGTDEQEELELAQGTDLLCDITATVVG